MTKTYSRLAKTEKNRATRSIIFYSALTATILVFMTFFGLTYLFKFTNYLSNLSGRAEVTEKDLPAVPLAPDLEDLPAYIKEEKLSVKGTARTGLNIIVVFNGGKKEVLADAQGEFNVVVDIKKDTENKIYAYATDNFGQESAKSKEFVVTFDDTEPKLEIINPASGSSFYYEKERDKKIEGQTEVNAKVTINGRLAIVNSEGKFNFTTRLAEGENKFTIIAIDKAGNETKIEDYVLNFSL